MIINFLSHDELNELLKSFIILKPASETYQLLSRYYKNKVTNIGDILKAGVKLKYEKHEINIRKIMLATNGALSINMEFMKKKNLIDNLLKKGNKMLVEIIKMNCSRYIENLEYAEYFHESNESSYRPVTYKYIHDARVFNKDWKQGYDISSLIISPDSHHGNDFVEFSFNADCYRRISKKRVTLVGNWNKYIECVSSRVARINNLSLDEKPFTKALLLHTAESIDEAMRNLSQIGPLKPIAEDETIEEIAATSAITEAHHITIKAMDKIGRSAIFMPYNPMPKDGPLVVTFSLFVLLSIQNQLEAEGINTEFKNMSARTADLFFLAYDDDNRVNNIKTCFKTFQKVAQSISSGGEEWHDNLMKLIPLHIMQQNSDDSKLEDLDTTSLIGKMLELLLKTVG